MADYADPDSAYLSSLESDATVRASAVTAASGEIDTALASSPRAYTVPVDVAALPAGDTTDRLTAQLDKLATAIAAYQLTRGHAGTGQQIMKDHKWAQKFLERLASGKADLPGVPRASSIRIGVAGSRKGDFPDELFDDSEALF